MTTKTDKLVEEVLEECEKTLPPHSVAIMSGYVVDVIKLAIQAGEKKALEAVENISKVIGFSRHETQRVMKEKDWQALKKEV